MGLTPEFGSFCLQACTVCLEDSNHRSGVNGILLNGNMSQTLTIDWASSVNQQVKRNWADKQEATEYGATAIAVLVSSNLSSFNCIEKSSKGTGFDYWIGDEDSLGIFQRKARLEISGILKESSTNTIEKRVLDKEAQTSRTAHLNMKAHICVMEFSKPHCSYKIL